MAAELLGKHLVQALRIKPDHYLVTDDNRGGGTAVVGAYQLKYRLLVRTNVFYLELNTFLRKVGLSPFTGRSAGLAVNHNRLHRHFKFSPSFTKIDSSQSMRGSLFCHIHAVIRGFNQADFGGDAGGGLQHG